MIHLASRQGTPKVTVCWSAASLPYKAKFNKKFTKKMQVL